MSHYTDSTQLSAPRLDPLRAVQRGEVVAYRRIGVSKPYLAHQIDMISNRTRVVTATANWLLANSYAQLGVATRGAPKPGYTRADFARFPLELTAEGRAILAVMVEM